MAIRLYPDLRRASDIGRCARLSAIFVLILTLLAFLSSPGAHADWQAGGHQETSYQQVCQDIADDWGGFFHPPQILSLTPQYDGTTGVLSSYNCIVVGIFSYTTNGSPIFPICTTGTPNASVPTGCELADTGDDTRNAGLCGKNLPGQGKTGDPLSVCNGNKFEKVTDYTTVGQNPLAFVRYYNSIGATYAPLGTADYSALINYTAAPFATLGSGWRSNYERNLVIVNSGGTPVAVRAQRPDGQVIKFLYSGGSWHGDTDISATLTQSGSTWTLTDKDDTVETYTNVNSSFALATSVQARNAYTQTLIYNNGSGIIANGNNLLTSVTDTYGRSLKLTYQNGLLNAVTSPDGLVLTYAYNSSGVNPGVTDRLISVSYSTSPVTNQTYLYEDSSFPFALTGIIDENGNRFATWTYDSFGRATSSQLAGGALHSSISFAADMSGNPVNTVTNALGQQTVYKFALLQNVPKITEIDRLATATTAGATKLFTYDSNGYLASQTDWNGNQTSYVNDARGQPTSVTEAAGTAQQRVTTSTYLSNFHLPSQIVGPLTTTNFTYDTSGNLLTRAVTDTTTFTVPYPTNGVTRTWVYTWSNSLLASIQGPRGAPNELLQFSYDSSGTLTGFANGLGQLTYIAQHTAGGLPVAIVDPNGVTTVLAYDTRQRLLTRSIYEVSGPLTTTYSYDPAGNRTGITLPDNSELTYSYDNAHRLTGIADLLNDRIAYTLDALGDRTETDILNPSTITTYKRQATFDALGRQLTYVAGAGQVTAYAYDNVGNTVSITDPLGHVTTRVFDALNRLTTITQPTSGVISLQYDAGDKINSVTDPNSNQTVDINDGFGDRIQEVSPDRGTTVYRFDLGGNLTQRVDAASTITNLTYDALDRILTTTYPGDSAENVAYTYDAGCGCNSIGRLSSLTDAAGSLTFAYNRRGLVTQTTRAHGTAVLITAYTYDPASRIASIGYPSGLTATYTRDVMGRITAVGASNPSISLSATVASSIAYEPFGSPTALTYGNGIAETRTYDLDYRETGLSSALSGTPVQDLTYAYDSADNVSTIADAVTPALDQAFGYDVLNRLVTANGGYNLTAANQTYTYNTGTNQLSTVTDGSTTIHQFAYSPTGNVTQDNRTGTIFILGYNQADRLASVQQGSTPVASYTYDAFGQRMLKTLPGTPATTILYQYDQARHQIEDSDISSGVSSPQADYIYLGNAPVGLVLGSTLYYYHRDRLGTPQLVTDGSGTVRWSGTYDPFGGVSVTSSITQNLRLPGQYADPETGWYHNGFRTYASDLGRYMQYDPIGLAGGPNPYAYARGNPVSKVDPFGLDDPAVNQSSSDSIGPPNLLSPEVEASVCPADQPEQGKTPPPPPCNINKGLQAAGRSLISNGAQVAKTGAQSVIYGVGASFVQPEVGAAVIGIGKSIAEGGGIAYGIGIGALYASGDWYGATQATLAVPFAGQDISAFGPMDPSDSTAEWLMHHYFGPNPCP